MSTQQCAVRGLFLICMGLLSAQTNAGQLYNVQFSGSGLFSPVEPTYSGPAATGSAGDIWNPIPDSERGTSGIPLSDSSGSFAAGVHLNSNVGTTYTDHNGNTPLNLGAYANLLSGIDLADGWGSGTGYLTVTGLPSGTYDLYAYSDPPNDGQQRITRVTANGVSGAIGPNNGTAPFVNGLNYIELQPIVGSNGLLSISFDGTSTAQSAEGDLNAFQFTQAPEPASLGLFGIGALGLLGRRRMRKG